MRVIKDRIYDIWDEGLKALEANYTERRQSTDPATSEEYLAGGGQRQHESKLRISSLRTTTIRVWVHDHEHDWSWIDVSRSNVTLLNSDRPIDKPLGLSDRLAYIAFPNGPKTRVSRVE